MLDIKAKDLKTGLYLLHGARWLKLDNVERQAQAPFMTLEAEGRVWETHHDTAVSVTRFPACLGPACDAHNVDPEQWPYCSDHCYQVAEGDLSNPDPDEEEED